MGRRDSSKHPYRDLIWLAIISITLVLISLSFFSEDFLPVSSTQPENGREEPGKGIAPASKLRWEITFFSISIGVLVFLIPFVYGTTLNYESALFDVQMKAARHNIDITKQDTSGINEHYKKINYFTSFLVVTGVLLGTICLLSLLFGLVYLLLEVSPLAWDVKKIMLSLLLALQFLSFAVMVGVGSYLRPGQRLQDIRNWMAKVELEQQH